MRHPKKTKPTKGTSNSLKERIAKRRAERRAKEAGVQPVSFYNGGNTYFDSKIQSNVRKVLPGHYLVNDSVDNQLVTVLGSCVSACIRDPNTGFGGMNHFMLPSGSNKAKWGTDALAFRYGNHAMEVLLNSVITSGCPRNDLEIKLFGGASVQGGKSTVGEQNIAFVRRFLQEEGLPIVAEDLGGYAARRIYYDTHTGIVNRMFLQRRDDWASITKEEREYRKKIAEKPQEDDIELFD